MSPRRAAGNYPLIAGTVDPAAFVPNDESAAQDLGNGRHAWFEVDAGGGRLMVAATIVRRTQTGWQVYGEIPAASVCGRKPPKASLEGQVWDLSFGRYNDTTGDDAPIISSTSPLTQAAYHRRHEWRQVRFTR